MVHVSFAISMMCLIKSITIHGLVKLPSVDENNILTTEAIVRDTINNIFRSLQLKEVRTKPKLKQYSVVHNYLVSLALQDYNTLKEIAKLAKVYDTDYNETLSFTAVLNELLNEEMKEVDGQKSLHEIDNIDTVVLEYIEYFLNKLNTLKEFNRVDDVYRNINAEVLKILNKTDDVSNNHSSENDSLLDTNNFWIPLPETRRIYRGDRTKIKYFPFMASIHIFNSFQCSGSIIKSDLIITAASCLQLAYNNRLFRENPSFLSVRVGSSFYTGGGENIPVMEVYFYPNYNPKNLRNNLALMRLVRRLKFRTKEKKLKKIKFDKHASPLPLTTDGVTIVGWGAKSASNIIYDPWKNILSFAELDIYPVDMCQDVYSKEYVTRKHFCAGFVSKGGGACNRDVGSPGIVDNVVSGVVSFGPPVCGTPDAPTVFTKLGYYTDWIEGIMEQKVPNALMRTTLLTTKSWIPETPAHYDIETTTFKLTPLTGNFSPDPKRFFEDNLRTSSTNDLFLEFIRTMFDSKELSEYRDLFLNQDDNESSGEEASGINIHKQSGTLKEVSNFVTVIDNFNPVKDSAAVKDVNKYSVFKKDMSNDLNKNIKKNLHAVDIVDDKGATEAPEDFERKLLNILLKDPKDDTPKNLDDAILTLLYLSDEKSNLKSNDSFVDDEKKAHVITNKIDDDSNGRIVSSVPVDTNFKDLTYRNNGTDQTYDFLSESDLNDIV